MKISRLTLIPFIFLVFLQISIVAQVKAKLNQKGENDIPQEVSLCELKRDPAAYNHKLLKITGFALKGFESSSISDPGCEEKQSIWMDYGGTSATGVMYCCGVTAEKRRSKPLMVENIPVSLTADDRFQKFDKLLGQEGYSTVRATMIGRFFAGKKVNLPSGSLWMGYGHMGCCSLFVIQQIETIEPRDRDDLDYVAYSDQPSGWSNYRILKVDESPAKLQQEAELNKTEWIYSEPQKVAADTLAKILQTKSIPIEELKLNRKGQGRMVYNWKNGVSKTDYMIVVSRPYWLSFYAKDPQKVAWTVIGLFELSAPKSGSYLYR